MQRINKLTFFETTAKKSGVSPLESVSFTFSSPVSFVICQQQT